LLIVASQSVHLSDYNWAFSTIDFRFLPIASIYFFGYGSYP
jgi:hypothetical protein